MIVVGSELLTLIREQRLASEKNYDNTCIQVSLGMHIKRVLPTSTCTELVYGKPIPCECIKDEFINHSGLLLKPHSAVLAVSNEEIYMPANCFGLLQTKGSLARMMVSLHFSDGQIDPGFKGHITYEIYNGSDFTVIIPHKSVVGNIYIFKAIGEVSEYNGRYAMSNEPTVQIE